MFEVALTVISAAFVLVTATLDPQAAMVVAVVAILCFVGYRVFFAQLIEDERKIRRLPAKKEVVKKVASSKSKSKSKSKPSKKRK